MSLESRDLISKLLNPDAKSRLSNVSQLKTSAFFCDVDWENIRSQPAPFIPKPEDVTDTRYFQGEYALVIQSLVIE